jgi:hypothetical protein
VQTVTPAELAQLDAVVRRERRHLEHGVDELLNSWRSVNRRASVSALLHATLSVARIEERQLPRRDWRLGYRRRGRRKMRP